VTAHFVRCIAHGAERIAIVVKSCVSRLLGHRAWSIEHRVKKIAMHSQCNLLSPRATD